MTAPLLASLDALIARLAEPLDTLDAGSGWTDELRVRWRERLVRVRTTVAAGERPLDDPHQLTRWLSFDRVGAGPLADAIAELQDELARTYRRRRLRGVGDAEAVRFLHQIGIRR